MNKFRLLKKENPLYVKKVSEELFDNVEGFCVAFDGRKDVFESESYFSLKQHIFENGRYDLSKRAYGVRTIKATFFECSLGVELGGLGLIVSSDLFNTPTLPLGAVILFGGGLLAVGTSITGIVGDKLNENNERAYQRLLHDNMMQLPEEARPLRVVYEHKRVFKKTERIVKENESE